MRRRFLHLFLAVNAAAIACVAAPDPLSAAFIPAKEFSAGGNPFSIAAADLDGDGDRDIALGNLVTNSVGVLLNTGNGTFGTATSYAAQTNPGSVTIADLDGDGDRDIAASNWDSNTVSIFLNAGNGTFAAAVNYATGLYPQQVIATDLDGDGDMDLATSNFTGKSISILRNAGNGTFGAAVNIDMESNTNSLAAADLDGDGDRDLVVAVFTTNKLAVLRNNGDATFTIAGSYGVGASPWMVAAADLDGDNDQDVVSTNNAGHSISVLKNDGDGTFGMAAGYPAGTEPYGLSITDADGDGDRDIAVASNGDKVTLFMNDGSGAFTSGLQFASGNGTREVVSADLDGDADIDLAVADLFGGTVSVFIQDIASPSVPGGLAVIGGTPTKDTTPTFTWNAATDNESGIAGYTWCVKADIQTQNCFESASGLTTNAAISELVSGTYAFSVFATDGVGNAGQRASIAFTIDNTPPAVGTISASPTPIRANQSVTFTATAVDANGSPSCALLVNGNSVATAAVTNGTVSASHVFSNTGSYAITFSCQDALGNANVSPTYNANVSSDTSADPSPPPSSGPSLGSSTSTNGTSPAQCPNPVATIGALVKLPDDGNPNTQIDTAVYYYGADCKRHAFPNSKTYFTWYTSFNGVNIVSADTLASMPLGKNVTYRPGVKMVKFATDDKVYAVSKGGALRWITTQEIARALYGSTWNAQIDDVSDAFYVNYSFGSNITDASQYLRTTELQAATTIDVNL